MLFYEAESCGKCFPCRVGTVRLRERLDALTGRADPSPNMMDEFNEIGAAMSANSAGGLGQAAPLVLHGLVRFFGEELEAHRQGVCPGWRLPLYLTEGVSSFPRRRTVGQGSGETAMSVTATIDGHEVELQDGETILEGRPPLRC